MKEGYRITVPELIKVPSEIVYDRSVVHRVNTVLWQGKEEPTSEVIDAQTEGQLAVRQQYRLRGYESPVTPLGNEMHLRRRGRFPLTGWKIVRIIEL